MNPPCIRGLKEFKKGCPQRSYNADDGTGCPAWIERSKVLQPDGSCKDIKECLDMWMFRLAWTQCGLLEGNQQATESFRNGMIENAPDGSTRPKAMALTIQKIATQMISGNTYNGADGHRPLPLHKPPDIEG